MNFYAPFISLINNVLSLHYLENSGAAFGILEGKQLVLIVITLLFIIMLGYIYYKDIRKENNKVINIGYELIIAGGLGNLVDRMFRNYVIDYIKLEFIDFLIFNLADIFINVGAFILIYCMICDVIKKKKI